MKKRKLKKSVKIILCGIFMGVISTATTIGLLAMNGSSIKVVNFVNQKKSDVEKWRKDNDIDVSQIIYKYEYSEEKDKNVVLKHPLHLNCQILLVKKKMKSNSGSKIRNFLM